MGNILLCDYDNKNLLLVDPLGKYLKKINLESEPFDVAITSQNIGYVTQPNIRSVLQVDPDRLVVLHKTGSNDQSNSVICVSAVPNSGKDIENKVPCYIGVKINSVLIAYPVNNYNICLTPKAAHPASYGKLIDPRVVKFHAFNVDNFVSCIGGQSYIKLTNTYYGLNEHIVNITTMVMPTDICSDNNEHIYISGQGSNNIHRLTKDGKVLDIPLDSQHGIKQPVALCFNLNYDKLYIVNEWGKSVLVFDII